MAELRSSTGVNPMNYQIGIGNVLASEAQAGALPEGRNSPQRCAHGLYAEQLSGSAFTAPRAQNQRTWVYRRLPSVVTGGFGSFANPQWCPPEDLPAAPPAPLRWAPLPLPGHDTPRDFVEGLVLYAQCGDPDLHVGIGISLYAANRSMQQRALFNADAEMLLLPQQGSLRIQTELGWLVVEPGELALVPRGLAFRVELDGPSRGYVCENWGRLVPMAWPRRVTFWPLWLPWMPTSKRLRSCANRGGGCGVLSRRTAPSMWRRGTALCTQ
jgi:homogentisate 1,2-dioxygenase